MRPLRLALLADGSSDRALLPILTWTLHSLDPTSAFYTPDFEARAGDLDAAIDRVANSLRPDMLFVHRDAERFSLAVRRAEIASTHSTLVRVVPVRMTEAWLLTDESAIRKAAGNPNGLEPLDVPRPNRLEALPDPKSTLRQLLIAASGLESPRRRRRFERDIARCVQLVAEYTDDFSALAGLDAYRAFRVDLGERLVELRQGTD